MQPKNQNNELSNNHIFIVGMSGCGKTLAVKRLFVSTSDQVIIFDPFRDYSGLLANRSVRGYGDLKTFAAAVLMARKSKQGFKIAYQPQTQITPAHFDQFCSVAWAAGDGQHKKPLKIVCEEVAEFSRSSGKADGYHGQLLRVGRKFGLHVINIFQRGQEVSKTILDNCNYACVMMQKTPDSATYLSKKTGIKFNDIRALRPLQYIFQDGQDYRKSKLRVK